jgi:DNA-directed RNA polymerase subunit RPC12/RpoP
MNRRLFKGRCLDYIHGAGGTLRGRRKSKVKIMRQQTTRSIGYGMTELITFVDEWKAKFPADFKEVKAFLNYAGQVHLMEMDCSCPKCGGKRLEWLCCSLGLPEASAIAKAKLQARTLSTSGLIITAEMVDDAEEIYKFPDDPVILNKAKDAQNDMKDDPIFQERGRLRDTWGNQIRLQLAVRDVACPKCGSNHLGWGCCNLDLEEAEIIAKESIDATIEEFFIGKKFGLSSIDVDKILTSHGLKEGKHSTQKALDEGFAAFTRLKDGTPFFLWNFEKVTELIGRDHKIVEAYKWDF